MTQYHTTPYNIALRQNELMTTHLFLLEIYFIIDYSVMTIVESLLLVKISPNAVLCCVVLYCLDLKLVERG